MSEEIILKTILTIILLPITLLHIYWACDGKIALEGAWPTDLSKITQKLSDKAFFILKFLLLLPVIIVLICLIGSFYILHPKLMIYNQQLYFIFSMIFIFRGLSGWFINKLSTKPLFQKRNTFIYSPIAFLIGILFYLLANL